MTTDNRRRPRNLRPLQTDFVNPLSHVPVDWKSRSESPSAVRGSSEDLQMPVAPPLPRSNSPAAASCDCRGRDQSAPSRVLGHTCLHTLTHMDQRAGRSASPISGIPVSSDVHEKMRSSNLIHRLSNTIQQAGRHALPNSVVPYESDQTMGRTPSKSSPQSARDHEGRGMMQLEDLQNKSNPRKGRKSSKLTPQLASDHEVHRMTQQEEFQNESGWATCKRTLQLAMDYDVHGMAKQERAQNAIRNILPVSPVNLASDDTARALRKQIESESPNSGSMSAILPLEYTNTSLQCGGSPENVVDANDCRRGQSQLFTVENSAGLSMTSFCLDDPKHVPSPCSGDTCLPRSLSMTSPVLGPRSENLYEARREVRRNSRARARRRVECLQEGEKIFDRYGWTRVLQEAGDGGKVVDCWEKGTGFHFIMKMKAKASLDVVSAKVFRRRLEMVMNIPPHENVVRLEKVLEDANFFYTVMWRANGGSLLAGLVRCYSCGVVPASALVLTMASVFRGLQHVHACGILHRDIKPDNILLELDENSGVPTIVKAIICDFDHAGPEREAGKTRCLYGTPSFGAPEIFLFQFSMQSDIYSVGCVLYLIVSGRMPYDEGLFDIFDAMPHGVVDEARCKQLYKQLRVLQVDWTSEAWSAQPLCFDFCRWLLAFKPGDRPEHVGNTFRHPWLQPDELSGM